MNEENVLSWEKEREADEEMTYVVKQLTCMVKQKTTDIQMTIDDSVMQWGDATSMAGHPYIDTPLSDDGLR